MKKNYVFALMSAIALTSAVGFTACSSDDGAVADTNPTYDGESVKTQFTITFPQNVVNTTRMTGTVVQSDPAIANFRGMDNITLIPFGKNSAITASDTRIGAPISLVSQIKPSTATVSNYITGGAGSLTADNNSVLYSDVEIPVGTGAFLFYGKAIDNAANAAISTIADKFKFGTLTPSAALTSSSTGVPTDISFTPVGIKETVSTEGSGTAADIATYLTGIANTTGWSTTDNDGLKEMYTRFIALKAGSSQAAADVIADLLWSIRNNTSELANKIRQSIYHNHDIAADGSIDCDANLISKIVKGTDSYTVTLGSKTSGYPANNNLPEGAAQIKWDDTEKKFTVTSEDIPTASSTSMNVAALTSYVYPANLQYYVNSPAVVSKSSQKDNYVEGNTWAQIIGGYDNSGAPGYVGVSTRSVAIKDPIQYGVGQLAMTVRAVDNTLEDNSDQLSLDAPVAVTVPTEGFPVTGILIGGQRAVDWEFLPNGTTFYTIYDNILKSHSASTSPIVVKKTASDPNYTLALETPVGEPVFIALELVNNTGATFYGDENQKILPGRTFYLVGELNPSTNTTQKYASEHKTYAVSGTSLTSVTKAKDDAIAQVFVQDYKTELNLTIKNLRKAMNTIPDLRVPQMEFGLSVDLNWQPGITFNVDL